MKTLFEQTIEEIEARIDTPFVTATFGNNWKEYADENMDKNDLIRIAWRQGRKAILLEIKVAELLSEERWISVEDRLPDLSIEYNVAWDLEDGYDELVTTTVEFDVKNKKWIDVINGGFDVTKNVKYWQPLPKPPIDLHKVNNEK